MLIQSQMMQIAMRKVVDICFSESLTVQNSDFPFWLTFDDGPHPHTTPYILEVLDKFQLKACFFVIGKNVEQYPKYFEQILQAGHAVGNHTFSHLSALNVAHSTYLEDVQRCQDLFPFQFFRPPYGRITIRAYKALKEKYQMVHWTNILCDWSPDFSPQLWEQVILKSKPEKDILVLHDSLKAIDQVQKIVKIIQKYHFKQ